MLFLHCYKFLHMRILILITFFFTTLLLQSQVRTYNLPPKNYYKRANVTLKNLSKFECAKIYIESDSVFFEDVKTTKLEALSLTDIKIISVKNVSGRTDFTLVGAVATSIPLMTYAVLISPTNLLFALLSGAAFGGVIGGFDGCLMGFAFPKWDVYYLEDLPN